MPNNGKYSISQVQSVLRTYEGGDPRIAAYIRAVDALPAPDQELVLGQIAHLANQLPKAGPLIALEIVAACGCAWPAPQEA